MANFLFNKTHYLKSKLAQLQKVDSINPLWQGSDALANLSKAIKDAGFTEEQHFMKFGAEELTSPNPYFDAKQYLTAKAIQMNAQAGANLWNAETIAEAIKDAGLSIYEHYQQHGWKEGVNPSNAFDANKYMASKLAQLQSSEPNAGWTMEKLQTAFTEAGLDPIAHAFTYGVAEGLAIGAVQNPVDVSPDNVFTLTENVSVQPNHNNVENVLMWGNATTGVGLPVDDVYDAIAGMLIGTDPIEAAKLLQFKGALNKIENITIEGVQDDLQGSSEHYDDSGELLGGSGDYTGNYEITITLNSGDMANVLVQLSAQQYAFIQDLLGNGEVFVGQQTASDTINVYTPIVLTPDVLNGTGSGDDTIVAGRLDLLHGATIDGGLGYNILEIDAKGTYAQPKELLNIQEVRIENLPNFYTTDGDGGGYLGNSTYPNISGDGASYSVLDLSRATQLEKLVITQGYADLQDGDASGIELGSLTVIGVRAEATLRLEGDFSTTVNVDYSQGLNGAITAELLLGDTTGAQLNFVGDASTLNLVSLGAGNQFASDAAGNHLVQLNISGEGLLHITNDLDNWFSDTAPVTIDASANTGGVILALDNSETVTFVGSQANDTFTVNGAKNATVNAGEGDNTIEAAGDVITVVAGDGDNEISVNAETIKVTTGEGANTIRVEGADITVNAAGSSNTITLVGTDRDHTADEAALIKINAGSNSTVVLGDANSGNNDFVAKEGSSIAGENLTLFIADATDLRAASLSGISRIVLDDDLVNGQSNGNTAQLTLTDKQAAQLAAENVEIGVNGGIFNAGAHIKIIVTESLDVTTGTWKTWLNTLPHNIDLMFEINDGATLKITAEQLHTKVAPEGVSISNDNNTDKKAGSVEVLEAGRNFDPFNKSDQIRTNIDGREYIGGSLDPESFTYDRNPDENEEDLVWVNVKLDAISGGDNRPADVPAYTRLTINTDAQNVENGPFETFHTFLRITGESDWTFTPSEGGIDEWGAPLAEGTAIALGLIQGVATNGFMVDFSSATGNITNLTLANFENAEAIYGNGDEEAPARVNVEIANERVVGGPNGGLVSRGVQSYVVTAIGNDDGDNEAKFNTCSDTEDLQTLGLRGNYGDTINFLNTERGVNFLLEVDYSKANGHSVGNLNAHFARGEGATAVVNVVNVSTRPLGAEGQIVQSIETNATALEINVEGGNTTIKELIQDNITAQTVVADLTLSADADLTIEGNLMDTLADIDASGVTGNLTVAIDLQHQEKATDLKFVGAAGSTTLTIDDAEAGDIASIEGAGEIALVIGNGTGTDNVNLSETTLNNVTSVTLNGNTTLTLTVDQVTAIGEANFVLADGVNVDTAPVTLTLLGLNDQPFAVPAMPEGVYVTVELVKAPTEITLHADTDLTGAAGLEIPEGSTLTLTAAQFIQLKGSLSGDGNVVITGVTQADADHEDFNLADLTLLGNVELQLAESVDLSEVEFGNNVDTITFGDDITLTLGELSQGNGVEINGGANSTLKFLETVAGNSVTIDASGFNVSTLEIANTLTSGSNANIDGIFAGLPGSVIKVIYGGVGETVKIDQVVNVGAGVSVEGALGFNPTLPSQELNSLTINLQGGTEIGNLSIDSSIKFDDKDGDGVQDAGESFLIRNYLTSLTINSTGTEANKLTGETANIIEGDISATGNNLLNVSINAAQELQITGSVVFSNATINDGIVVNDKPNAEATLTVNGPSDVTIENLNVADANIATLNVVANGGNFTVTGASPSINAAATKEISFSGSSDIVLGNDDADQDDGIESDGDSLSLIDASGLTGNLSIEDISWVKQTDFTFESGSGVTTVRISDSTLSSNGLPAGQNGQWTFDLSNAAAGSQLTFGNSLTWTDGDLSVDLGSNAQLVITADTNWEALDSISINGTIVLADGVTLTLTAEQANGLTIIGASGVDSTGVVNITQLGDDAVDLSDIDANIAGTVTLEDNDVTLHLDSDLGDFSITLQDVAGDNNSLAGQTIRFQTADQAEREINVDDVGTTTTSSTNVVWLFEDFTGAVDTNGYGELLGRLWITDALIAAAGGNIEDLFTSLPNTILRAEFADASFLDDLLASLPINRTLEVVSFETLGDLTFNSTGNTPDAHLATVTLKLGGQSTVGDILINNTVAGGTDPDTAQGTKVTIESHLALADTHFLAAEGYFNDYDGVVEEVDGEREHVLPEAVNKVGDIKVGAGFDLLTVTLDTQGLPDATGAAGNAGSAGGAGAALEVGTIYFNTDEEGEIATVTLEGANNVKIKSLDTSEMGAGGSAGVVNNLVNAATYVTGGSPAAAVQNIEVLYITTTNADSQTYLGMVEGEDGEPTLNLDDNGVPYAGVAGAALSLIEIDGQGSVNLGVIAQIDGTDDGESPAFELHVEGDWVEGIFIPTATVTAILGEANVDGTVVAPTLAAGSTWSFTGVNLTITEDVVFEAGGFLHLTGVNLTLEGDVDLSVLDLTIEGGGSIDVPAGMTLELTAEQAHGLTVTGEGSVVITGVENVLNGDYSAIMTSNGDTGSVTLNISTADGDDAGTDPDTLTFTGELGVAKVVVSGGGTLMLQGVNLAGVDRDGDSNNSEPTPNDRPSFVVQANTTLQLNTEQADGLLVSGAGATTVVMNGDTNADLSGVTTTSSVLQVQTSGEFTGDLGSLNVYIPNGVEFLVAYSDIAGARAINGELATDTVATTGELHVALDEDDANADLSTLTGNLPAANRTAIVTEDMTFTGKFFAGGNVVVQNGVDLTVSAALLSGLAVDADNAGDLVITALQSSLAADLSGIDVADFDSVTAELTQTATFTGKLPADMVVTLADDMVLTTSASNIAAAEFSTDADGEGTDATLVATVGTAESAMNLSTLANAGDAVISSIVVTQNVAFTGTLPATIMVADGVTLTVANSSFVHNKTVNAGLPAATGAVVISAVTTAATLAGSADFTATAVAANVNAAAVTGDFVATLAATATGVLITTGQAANTVNAQAMAGGTTVNIAGAGAVTVNAGSANVSAITATGVVTLQGGAGNNSLTGGSADDTLNGAAGDDLLSGGAGNDTLMGGTGIDILNGGDGNDTLNGGEGADSLTGGAGNDTFELAGNDTVVDFTTGDAVNLSGLANGDAVTFTTVTGALDLSTSTTTAAFTATAAAAGASITGGAGNDTLNGGAGIDTLNGGAGTDVLTGGAGNDVFVFTNTSGSTNVIDEISDFEVGDTIKTGTAATAANYSELTAADYGAGVADLSELLLAANAAMSGLTGAVKYVVADNASTDLANSSAEAAAATLSYLFIDWDGNNTVDQAIKLTGVADLSVIDFSSITA